MTHLTLDFWLDERTMQGASPDAEPQGMTTPLVHCAGCERAWHSATMADGLRLIGSCPRCGGTLIYAQDGPGPIVAEQLTDAPAVELAPHLVLGVPRR